MILRLRRYGKFAVPANGRVPKSNVKLLLSSAGAVVLTGAGTVIGLQYTKGKLAVELQKEINEGIIRCSVEETKRTIKIQDANVEMNKKMWNTISNTVLTVATAGLGTMGPNGEISVPLLEKIGTALEAIMRSASGKK